MSCSNLFKPTKNIYDSNHKKIITKKLKKCTFTHYIPNQHGDCGINVFYSNGLKMTNYISYSYLFFGTCIRVLHMKITWFYYGCDGVFAHFICNQYLGFFGPIFHTKFITTTKYFFQKINWFWKQDKHLLAHVVTTYKCNITVQSLADRIEHRFYVTQFSF